ncbi:hypothetical protein M438DRAFT_14770 [Aureobasidium pullulans EXF-150]|uniref:Uncharacterized protein n=1 Tax=Aureobasidium pullulans EXF-150 TaxID=1043002 RepID=A0A074YSH6_AURPU|nr:uncharacterized protein M438DRAFT_14770 [Aureobasidium pullulans EXF-150]KEQ89821.1 hypothetical protein M438DRAFT_14770 [Aureobasidium pullulans EXF-150]
MLSRFFKSGGRLANSPWNSTPLRYFSSCPVNQISRARYDQLRLDPEKHKVYVEKTRAYMRQRRKDPEHCAKLRVQKEKTYARESFRRARLLHMWCNRYVWFREELPWKSRRPLVLSEPTKHYCEGCEYTRFGGMKMWWFDSESYMCNACYAKADWNEVMPKGYEDCRNIKEVAARKEQLGALPDANKPNSVS